MLAEGSRVVMVDRDEAALKALCNKHGDAVIPLVINLLDPKDCATLLPRVLGKRLDALEQALKPAQRAFAFIKARI
jgi:NADP-dependent 3-hydroxy acid dehydrogenase YdfG